MSNELYAGAGSIIETKYGALPKMTLHKDHVNAIVKWMKSNNSDFCNLVLKKKKDQKESNYSHYLEIDEWKPEQQQPLTKNEVDNYPTSPQPANDIDDSDVPF